MFAPHLICVSCDLISCHSIYFVHDDDISFSSWFACAVVVFCVRLLRSGREEFGEAAITRDVTDDVLESRLVAGVRGIELDHLEAETASDHTGGSGFA